MAVDYKKESLNLHEEKKGKIEIRSKVSVKSKDDLSIAYTPGVAEPCIHISKNKNDVYKYTSKGNMVAVITDGTAVLGLGDIGPEASLPVMEGKAILFKEFGGVDAFPIAVSTKDVDEFVKTVKLISPMFGGINLEDISAPRCFEIEERLKHELDIPVFHDDQHGTAIVVLAGLTNALKLAGKEFSKLKVVMSGAGAAGTAIAKLLMTRGVRNIIMTDRSGAIYAGRAEHMNPEKEELAKITNPLKEKGSLADVMKGADVFIGVSSPGLVSEEMVRSMAKKPIIFAMANPTPEIMPDVAHRAGAFIIATGRSDFPNQINNILAFPAIFKIAHTLQLKRITMEVKIALVQALASLIEEPSRENVIVSPFYPNLVDTLVEKVVAKLQ